MPRKKKPGAVKGRPPVDKYWPIDGLLLTRADELFRRTIPDRPGQKIYPATIIRQFVRSVICERMQNLDPEIEENEREQLALRGWDGVPPLGSSEDQIVKRLRKRMEPSRKYVVRDTETRKAVAKATLPPHITNLAIYHALDHRRGPKKRST